MSEIATKTEAVPVGLTQATTEVTPAPWANTGAALGPEIAIKVALAPQVTAVSPETLAVALKAIMEAASAPKVMAISSGVMAVAIEAPMAASAGHPSISELLPSLRALQGTGRTLKSPGHTDKAPEAIVEVAPAPKVMAVSPGAGAVAVAIEATMAAGIWRHDSYGGWNIAPPQASALCYSEPLPGPTGPTCRERGHTVRRLHWPPLDLRTSALTACTSEKRGPREGPRLHR